MKLFKLTCLLVCLLGFHSTALLASEEVIELAGIKLKASFLKDKKKDCKSDNVKMSCFLKDSGSMIVITVGPKESEDDFSLYAKALKSKKVNLPLISKPLLNELFWQEKRQWIYSVHSNAEVPDYFTSYYLTVVKQKVLLLSVTSKDNSFISEFKKTTFKGFEVL